MKLYSTSAYALCIITTTLLLSSPHVFSFGTLMTSSKQRIELDRIRNGLVSPSLQHNEYSSSRATKMLELDGLVKRHNGPNTIWVNGAIVKKGSIGGVSIDAGKLVDSAVVFKLSSGTRPLLIKPGQRLGIEEANVDESYNSNKLINIGRNSQYFEDGDDAPLPVYKIE